MKEQLILDNLNLIYFIMNKMELYKNKEDYYYAGLIGLINAANSYDPDKGMKFSTLATVCIRNQILIEIRERNSNKRKANFNTISLETVVGHSDKNDLTLGDLIPDAFNMEEHVENKELLNNVIEIINELTEDEKILIKYYILDEMTQADIAKKLGMCQGHISRKINKILTKIRVRVERKKEWEIEKRWRTK